MKTLTLALIAIGMSLAAPAQNLKFGPANAPTGAEQPIDEIGLIINDEAITRRQLAQEMETARKSMPKDLKLPAGELEHQLLEHIIMNHLLAQIEQKAGLDISEDELNAAIAQIAERNKVSEQKLYAQAQRDTGLNRDAFRAQIRKSLAQEHLKEGMVGADINISDRQVDEYLAKLAREQGSTIHVQDLLIPLPDGDANSRAKEVDNKIREVSQALRDAHYNDLGDVNLGTIPPRFARALAKLGAGEIVENPVVDDDGMHFLKVAEKHNAEGNYTLAEADVSHILLRTNDGHDDASQKAQIDAIYRELQAGADFASLARRYSEDAQTAAKGGDLGWVSADQFSGELAQAIEKQSVGSISKPVKTPYGYHIILVRDRRQSDKSESVVREQIKRNLYAKALDEAWQQRLQALRREAYIDIR